MSHREFSTANWIIDHTVGWGRAVYKTTHREMVEGSPVSVGVGLSLTQVKESLNALKQLGFVSVVSDGRGIEITPNLNWEPPKVLPTPKRLKVAGNPPTRSPETRLADSRKSDYQVAGNPTPFIVQSPRTLPQNSLAEAGFASPADVRLSGNTEGTEEAGAIQTGPALPVPSRSAPQVRKRFRPAPASSKNRLAPA